MPSTDLVYSKLWQIKSTKVNVPKNCQKKRLSLNNIYGQSHDKWETKRRCVIRPKVVMSLCDEHNLNRIYSLQFDNISTFGRWPSLSYASLIPGSTEFCIWVQCAVYHQFLTRPTLLTNFMQRFFAATSTCTLNICGVRNREGGGVLYQVSPPGSMQKYIWWKLEYLGPSLG